MWFNSQGLNNNSKTTPECMNSIIKLDIYYINLEQRQDRNKEDTKEFNKAGSVNYSQVRQKKIDRFLVSA